MKGVINTDTWYPVILTDNSDFKSPIIGKTYSDITCKYFKTGSTSQTIFSVTASNWKEAGDGKYSIKIGAAEWVELTNYQVSVLCFGCINYNFPVEVDISEAAKLQVIRDSMALDLSIGVTPEPGSIDQHIDEISAVLGGYIGSVPITIHLQDAGGAPIFGGYVQVFDDTMLSLQTAGNTDVDGNLFITLNPGNYKLLISKQMIYTFDVPQSITVTGPHTYTFVGSQIPFIPPLANCQLVYLYPIDLNAHLITKTCIVISPQDENDVIDPYFLVHKRLFMQYIPERTRFEANVIKGANVIVDGKAEGSQFIYGKGQIDSANSKNLVDYEWISREF